MDLLAGWVLLSYLALAFTPFHPDRPRRLENGAEVGGGQGIRFPSAGIVRARSSTDWVDRAIRLASLDIEIDVRTGSTHQFGPARIWTLSHDHRKRNLTIGQEDSDLVIRLRTPETSSNGTPAFTIPGVFEDRDWHRITVRVRPGSIRATVDGDERLDERLPDRPLSNWDRGYRVALGNEWTGHRPWLGEIARAVVRVDGIAVDYAREDSVEVPETYWSVAALPIYPFAALEIHLVSLRDGMLNFLGFIPLGFLLAMHRGSRWPWTWAVAACAVVSYGVENAQVLFESHYPSVTDWILNTTGGALGALIARGLSRSSVSRDA